MDHKYSLACLGGAFDHLHRGHKHFIDAACSSSQKITVGLSTEKLLENKLFKQSIEDYETRKKSLERYLEEKGYIVRTKIFPLDDIYGESITDGSLNTIFVTDVTSDNAEKINEKRQELGFSPLETVIVPPVLADDGGVISSTRIRKGEIDGEGNSYLKLFKKTLKLPDSLREKTRSIPKGALIKNASDYKEQDNELVISVGDVVSERLLTAGNQAGISIVDLKSRREDIKTTLLQANLTAQNDAGAINSEAVSVIKSAIDQYFETGGKQVIKVIGEEDLLALPALILAPLGSKIIYGMQGEGAIVSEVLEENKIEVRNLIEHFNMV